MAVSLGKRVALVFAGSWPASVGQPAWGKGRVEVTAVDKELAKDCPWILSSPQWRSYIRPAVESIEGLSCTPKPEGQLRRLGHLDTSGIWNLTQSITESKWFENDLRQRRFVPHKDTQSILLAWNKNIFTGQLDPTLGGAITSSFWPSFEPFLRPLVELVKNAYNMPQPMVWRAMLARLPAGKSITEHWDANPVLSFPRRIHWVVHTNPGVVTNCAVRDGDVPTPIPDLGEGDVFELNNVRRHSVHNSGSEGRVHLVIDMYPRSLESAGVESIADGIDLLKGPPRAEL